MQNVETFLCREFASAKGCESNIDHP